MTTIEQKLSESLLAACKAAGIDKPMYITQNRSGDVYHNNYKPRIKNDSIWCYNDGTKFLNHPPYSADWQESLLEWVEPQVKNFNITPSAMVDKFREKFIEPNSQPLADFLARHPDANQSECDACELAEATKQRDALAEAGRMCIDTMNTSSISRMLPAKNAMTAALAAAKGGSDDS